MKARPGLIKETTRLKKLIKEQEEEIELLEGRIERLKADIALLIERWRINY